MLILSQDLVLDLLQVKTLSIFLLVVLVLYLLVLKHHDLLHYLKIKIGYSISPDINFNDVIINIAIHDKENYRITNFMSYEVKSQNIGEKNILYLEIPSLMLKGGVYFIRWFASYKNTLKENFLDDVSQAISFNVIGTDYWQIGRVMDESNNAFFEAKYLF